MSNGMVTYLPANDDYPGLKITWGKVQCACCSRVR